MRPHNSITQVDGMNYNICRIHKALRPPTIAAGVTDKLWVIGDIVTMLDDWEVAN
jgi:hypothetical protein